VDFFISFNSADTRWAEWIAWPLKEEGRYEVCVQLWDFAPGTNFFLDARYCARVEHNITVLSPAYLRAEYSAAEWAAAFVRDPRGIDGT
jgi:hypothetical protein